MNYHGGYNDSSGVSLLNHFRQRARDVAMLDSVNKVPETKGNGTEATKYGTLSK